MRALICAAVVATLGIGCGDDSPDPGDVTIVATDPSGTITTELVLSQTSVGQSTARTLVITNNGQQATGHLTVSVSGAAAGDFVLDTQATTCSGLALAPGASCDIVIVFQPTASGERTATLMITSDPGGTISIALSGTAVMPDLHFVPTSVSFNQIEIGQTGQATIELHNDGTATAAIDDLVASGPGFARGISTCGDTLAPGASCDIALTAAPTTLGNVSGAVAVMSDGETYSAALSASGARRITISRNGTGMGSVVSSPAGIDCGSTCSALFETDVELTGTADDGSELASWSVDGCNGSTCNVAGATTPITVTATFNTSSGSGLHFVGTELAFGQVEIGVGDSNIVELTNDGATAVPIDDITITGVPFSIGITTCGSTLAAGTSCDIVVDAAPQTLGGAPGSLTVTSGADTVSLDLSVIGARRITVILDGTGIGKVVGDGIDCGAQCSALVTGTEELDAIPEPGNALISWSVPGCTGLSCSIVADITPITVTASFALTGSSTVEVDFAGTGIGEVKVIRYPVVGVESTTTCFGSCSLTAEPGDDLWVYAATPSTFGGFSGPCTSTVTEPFCHFSVPVGTVTLTSTFNKDPAETWTRLLFPSEPIIAVTHDGSGNVIAATAQRIVKLSSAGTTVWTRQLAVDHIEAGPSDSIYVIGGGTLRKLDASSADVWTQAVGGGCTGRCFAVNGSGTVATVAGIWDTNGTLLWTPAIPLDELVVPGIEIDNAGVVYLAVESSNTESKDALRFDATGSPLTTWLNVGMQYDGDSFAIDSDGRLVTSTSGHSKIWLKRMTAAGGTDWTQDVSAGANSLPNGMSANGTGKLAWWHKLDDGLGARTGHRMSAWTNAGVSQWSLDRYQYELNFSHPDVGPLPSRISIGDGDQVVVGGRFVSFTFSGAYIQAFQLP
ncbi:MAG: choice-of-anchor D domain-containing protein [Kofleriaceae bacterium]